MAWVPGEELRRGATTAGAGGFTMASTLSKFLMAWKIEAVPKAPTPAAPMAPGPL